MSVQQVNITISKDCKDNLKRLARKKSAELDKDLTYIDMIKFAIKDQYNIEVNE